MTHAHAPRWKQHWAARRDEVRYLIGVCRESAATAVRHAVTGPERRLWRRYLLDRFGFWGHRPRLLRHEQSIVVFINAGEILGITVFCATLRRLFPEHNLILAIDNVEAYLIGEQHDLADVQIFTPWDFAWLARRMKRRFGIDVAVFLTKIFHPVVSRTWRQMGVSTGMVSGHFTREMVSLPSNVPIWGRLFRQRAYEELDYVAMQDAEQKQELLKHIDRGDIIVLGNVRADVSHALASADEQAEFRRRLQIGPEIPLIIAAATRRDEGLILEAFQAVVADRPETRLVIMPRHLATAAGIVDIAQRKGLDVVPLSQLREEASVVVVDVPILLAKLYSIATVIVFARTFHEIGGWSNILEPAFHAKPIVFGRQLKLWPDGLAELRNREPRVCVSPDPAELTASLTYFLSDRAAAAAAGHAFKALTSEGEEIAKRNARLVLDRAATRDVVRAPRARTASWAS